MLIKNIFVSIGIFMFAIFIIFGVLILDIKDKYNEVKNLKYYEKEMHLRADELRESSNDLTKYARLYVVTGNKVYKDNYFKILSIRNGEAARPYKYENIYWDLLEPLRTLRHPDDKKVSLKAEIEQLPFSAYEFQKLKEAEDNSNELVNLEFEAFNAMEGIFKNEKGIYALKKGPSQQFAVFLLHSPVYLKAKEKIMLPIDEFMVSLHQRTNKAIADASLALEHLIKIFYFIMIVWLFSFLIALLVVWRKVVIPNSRQTA
jgi:methyl-accepting chemotaxis protein